MRVWPVSLWSLVATLFIAGSGVVDRACARADEPKRLNVLFMVADDLNCDLGCYGHPQVRSPNIDRLARDGVRFDQAYCQFPLCSPSRSSFLTGLRPNHTKVWTNPGRKMPGEERAKGPHFRDANPETVTMPQLFRKHGYQVARVGKLFHYGVPAEIGTDGFDDPVSWDRVVNPRGRDKTEEAAIFTLKAGEYGGTLSWMAADGTDAEQTDGIAAREAEKLLEQFRGKPFFLAVGFYRPHTPYVSTKNFFAMYPLDQIKLPGLSAEDLARQPAPAFGSAKPEQDKMTDNLRQQAIQAYWASISLMDAQVGYVLAALDRLGLAENTVVVMTSDHGYHLHDHGLWQKMSLFERSARVPLIIRPPVSRVVDGAKSAEVGDVGTSGKARRRSSTRALAELVDVYPTLADYCGLPLAHPLDGVSQKAVVDGQTETVKDTAFTQVRRGKIDGYSLRSNRYRYTLWDAGKAGEQLYDLESDPSESNNLAAHADHADRVRAFRERLTDYAGK